MYEFFWGCACFLCVLGGVLFGVPLLRLRAEHGDSALADFFVSSTYIVAHIVYIYSSRVGTRSHHSLYLPIGCQISFPPRKTYKKRNKLKHASAWPVACRLQMSSSACGDHLLTLVALGERWDPYSGDPNR